MLGVPKNSVILCPYSEEWSRLFEIERTSLCNKLKEHAVDIQHVGSTSIVRMSAKPIIDIVIVLKNFNEGFALIEDIETLGYHYKGSLGKSKRFFFWKGSEYNNTYNLHLVECDDNNYKNFILFRNFMNEHSDYRDKYLSLKMELAAKFKDDRGEYTKGKTEFILKVIELAKQQEKES